MSLTIPRDSAVMQLPETQATQASQAAQAHVYVVDDDPSVRTAVTRLLSTEGYAVSGYASAELFLQQYDPDMHGCIVLDVAMPGQDGLGLQQVLCDCGGHMPVIFLTGQADVPMAVQAMQRGAIDFLTKPIDESVLFAAVRRALERDRVLLRARERRAHAEACLAALTPRERQVVMQVVAGRLNKQIAYELGTAEKTVKVHRARGMEKMQVRSVADLVRLVERLHPSEAC